MTNTVSPFVMVIFGATGDLTSRKLMPALYHLLKHGILPDRFFIVGFARRNLSNDEFKRLMRDAIEKYVKKEDIELDIWDKLEKNIYYQRGFFEEKAPYEQLIPLLKTFDDEIGACITRFFYLATPPPNYSEIIRHLDETKLDEGCGQGSSKWTRILIEKPFGKDMNEAKKLEEQIASTFEERQIYRIDHYLAKETIQNMLTFRFANQIEAIWNKDFIDHVQITLAESDGIGRRGKFYEGMGALKDVGQNHLMAMLAYTTMDEPNSMTAGDIRAKRVEILAKIVCPQDNEVNDLCVRGQYGRGMIHGKEVLGYRKEKDVDTKSNTETFVAFKLFIDSPRWMNVPFYLRTGKRLKESVTRIDIFLKNRSSSLFKQFQSSENQIGNLISIRVQPKEGISMRFFTKVPGLKYEIQTADMDFSYSNRFKKEINDSYEKILLDSMLADQTLFATASGFSATWEYISAIIRTWEKSPLPKFPNYPSGSWGPEEAQHLIRKDGKQWIIG